MFSFIKLMKPLESDFLIVFILYYRSLKFELIKLKTIDFLFAFDFIPGTKYFCILIKYRQNYLICVGIVSLRSAFNWQLEKNMFVITIQSRNNEM